MLRIRRNILGEVPFRFRWDGAHQDRFDSEDWRVYCCIDRFQLSHAIAGRDQPRGRSRQNDASGRGAGEPLTMSATFDRKIEETLADKRLQGAVYTFTGRLQNLRAASV